MKHSKKKKKWTKKRKGKTKTNNKKERQKKREGEREKGYPPNPSYFSEWFFTCSLPGSLSKYLEDKTLTLLKLYYPLSAIFCKSFLWVI